MKLSTLVNKGWLIPGYFSNKKCCYGDCTEKGVVDCWHHPIPEDQFSCLNHFGVMNIFREGSVLGNLDQDIYEKVRMGIFDFEWR